MKIITLNLYEYAELSDEAKARALSDWNEYNDDPLMQSHMINVLKEELEERGIKYDTDSIDVRYSLSYSQGDGFMFEGLLDWKGHKVQIKHHGHYYHSNSKIIEIWDDAGEFVPEGDEKDYMEFEKIYQEICKKMEQIEYDEIEYQQSAENFERSCEENEYTFEENGKMRNA